MGTAVDLRNFYHCTACYPVDMVLDTLTSSACDRSCIYNIEIAGASLIQIVDLWMCFKFSVSMNGNDLNSFEKHSIWAVVRFA